MHQETETAINKDFALGYKQATDIACVLLRSSEIEVKKLFGVTTVPFDSEFIEKFRSELLSHLKH